MSCTWPQCISDLSCLYLPKIGTDDAVGGAASISINSSTIKLPKIFIAAKIEEMRG